ncbi:MAG: hypothetical protein M3Q97_05745, partial [Bacteroidota bacterium]|nr:hypothetical protein [Bacteroidota bacterium]
MIRHITILGIFLVTGFFTVKAQTLKEFSTDPKTFSTQLKTFFASAPGDAAQETIKEFLEVWGLGTFSPSEQATIIGISNKMLKARMRPSPDFEIYLNMLLAAKRYKVPEDKLLTVNNILTQILEKDKRNFEEFASFSRYLFSDLIIYRTTTRNWKISNNQYAISLEGNEPVLTFPAVEVQLFTSSDTLGIYETSGKYYPLQSRWVGKGGEVYWTRVGFAKSKASAQLNNYRVDMKGTSLEADSAMLSFPQLFSTPIMGKLSEKALTETRGDKASFPRFTSYKNVLELKNIFRGIDYKGGFSLEGSQIQGTGTDSALAMVTYYYQNKVTLRAYSSIFVIGTDYIVSGKAAVSIFLEKDSVYHTQLIFNYQEKKRTLTLSRDNNGLFAAPYYDSYHQLEYDPQNIIWNIDEPLMYLKSISNPDQPVHFESAHHYSEANYVRTQGLLDYHPLKKIQTYIENSPTKTVTVEELAVYFNNQVDYLINLFYLLAKEGYIFYDVQNGTITVKDKLTHYVKSYEKKSDYDIINFTSIISGLPNASISLISYELKVEGVPRVGISDSQETYFVPTEQTLRVGKNRHMAFAGQVHSGRFDFWGKELTFDYAKFQVNLTDVDSVKFKFPEYDKNGRFLGLRTIQNTIQDVNGYLYIDDPLNKSGRRQLVDYPIFECNKESYVYYDKKHIYNGVYDRDIFFFKINPFIIKQLDDFTAEGLRFPGTLVSADIIPNITYDLTIQEDFSLGLIVSSPEKGYTMYRGKGIGKGSFLLSNSGFRANGEIDYLVSKTRAQNFLLFPDSTTSNSDQFVMTPPQDSKYPDVNGTNVYNRWMPYKDSMYVYRKKEPISVYSG